MIILKKKDKEIDPLEFSNFVENTAFTWKQWMKPMKCKSKTI